MEEIGSKEVDNNKDIRVSAIRGKKIITTTASTISVGGKLLMVSTKIILLKGR